MNHWLWRYGGIGLLLGSGLAAGTGWAQTPGPAALTRAEAVATSDPACVDIQPFYWELGGKPGAQASGSVGANAPTANTVMPIASASKWLFGAYVEQVRNGELLPADIQALTMHSGYVSHKHRLCVKMRDAKQAAMTVAQCFTESGPLAGRNDALSADEIGKFHYSGGHFQFWAVQNGLANLNNASLAAEMNRVLGTELQIGFASPQLAGGAQMSGAHYGLFLQKLLRNELILGRHLGEAAVCTQHPDCPDQAVSSPLPDNLHWHYSLGHWVEDGAPDADGAFSSAGAFGFYPWISADKQHYGVIARMKKSLLERPAPESVLCGRKIRAAWLADPLSGV